MSKIVKVGKNIEIGGDNRFAPYPKSVFPLKSMLITEFLQRRD